MGKLIKSIMALAGIVGLFFSIYFFVDNRYALAEEFKSFHEQVTTRFLQQDRRDVSDRIWRVRDRYQDSKGNWLPNVDQVIKQEYQELLKDKQDLDDQLNNKEKGK